MIVRKCEIKEIDRLVQFAYRINGRREHASTFCPGSLLAIRQEFEESIDSGSLLSCWRKEQLLGILNCYTDEEKGNTDCSLLIEQGEDYGAIAEALFTVLRKGLNENMRYTFFFPKQNIDCSRFLEKISAQRRENEYGLLLERGRESVFPAAFEIGELRPEYYEEFISLHDHIFPGAYISGKDIVEDLGKNHLVYAFMDKCILAAYSVLRLNGGKRATAEIIGVKEGFRGMGYGKAVLGKLIEKSFWDYGMDCVDLIVEGDNEKAIELYLSVGFAVEFESCCYIWTSGNG